MKFTQCLFFLFIFLFSATGWANDPSCKLFVKLKANETLTKPTSNVPQLQYITRTRNHQTWDGEGPVKTIVCKVYWKLGSDKLPHNVRRPTERQFGRAVVAAKGQYFEAFYHITKFLMKKAMDVGDTNGITLLQRYSEQRHFEYFFQNGGKEKRMKKLLRKVVFDALIILGQKRNFNPYVLAYYGLSQAVKRGLTKNPNMNIEDLAKKIGKVLKSKTSYKNKYDQLGVIFDKNVELTIL